MISGEIQQCDDPMNIYDDPANKFVAGFLGSPPINTFKGKIKKKDSKLYFDDGKFTLKIVPEMIDKLKPYIGKDIVLGARAEDIYDKLFVTESSPDNTIRATCEVVEPLGSEVYLYLTTGNHPFIARVGAHNRPEVNKDMELVFDMSKVHFFDAETEKTLI
jgi:multiple sugar transport system ATP-binding protein